MNVSCIEKKTEELKEKALDALLKKVDEASLVELREICEAIRALGEDALVRYTSNLSEALKSVSTAKNTARPEDESSALGIGGICGL